MPLPTPNKNEKRNDFIARCVSSPIMQSEYKDNHQRLAICYTQWTRSKKKKVS